MIYDRDTGRYEPLDLYGTYRLAGYNYTLRDLGDGFAMFDGAENIIDYVMEDYLVLANYIRVIPDRCPERASNHYAENSPYGSVYGEGRITTKCSHDVAQVKISGTIEATCTEAGYTGRCHLPDMRSGGRRTDRRRPWTRISGRTLCQVRCRGNCGISDT